MKNKMIVTAGLFCLSFLFLVNTSAFSQQAAAELITSMPTPFLEGNISIKDGERFVTYRDNYLFAVNFWLGIEVWDISRIESPSRVSFLRTKDMIYHVTLDENRLYAANKAEGVIIFDISNLSRPFEVGRIKTPGDAYWVDVNYPYLYVAMGSEGFCVMDITNLDDPRTLTLEIPDTWIWSLEYRDERLYVAAKQGGFNIYDAANPFNLVRISQYKTGFHVLQFQIEDSLVYVADGPGGLLILDISAPRLPKQVGRYATSGFTRHVYKSGNYAYLANREQGLLIIKVNDPANPTLEARYVSESETYAAFKEDVYVFISANTKTEILRHNNRPILARIADPVIEENVPYVLQLQAHDPDGDKIYFESGNLPPGSTFDGRNGIFTWTPTYEQSGIYPNILFSVIEQTGSKLSDSDTITITVKHVNRMPELPAIANAQIPEDSLLTILVPEGSDPDREDQGKLYYRVENAPPGAKFDSLKRVFTWKPTFDQSGVYIVDFVLYDGAGGADREAVTITVLHVDRPPIVQAVPNQTVNEAETLTVTVSGTELDQEDQDKISFSLFNLPAGALFEPVTRQFSWTPTYEQSGDYPKIGVVMKGGKLSDTTFFDITVTHVNRPPLLAAITDPTVDESKPLNFIISGSDPDKEDAGKLVYSAENLPPGAAFNADSLRFNWTPTFEQSGIFADILFTVKDPQGLSDQKTITITVNHVNRPPVLTEVPPATVDENTLLQFQLSASDPDIEDAGKLVYSSTALPAGAALDAVTGTFSWTPTYDQSGQYPVTFTVSDGRLTDSKATSIVVRHVNRPPVLSDIPGQTVEENKPLTIAISGSDPDKEDQGQLTYSAQNLPVGSQFNPSTRTFSWTPTYEQSGVYSDVLFRVADSAGLSAERPTTITVLHVNRLPQLSAVTAQTVNEQETVTFTLQGSDPDREDEGKLRYQISNLPDGAILNAISGEFSWTPGFDQSGPYSLNAQVVDSAGAAAQIQIPITVVHVNRPPLVEPLPSVTGRENEALTIALKFSDPDPEDAGKLSVTASGLPPGAQLNASSGIITWTPTFEQSGAYTIDFTVTDGTGANASGSVSVTIENVNRPPTIPTTGALTVNENELLSTTLPEGSDPDPEDAGKLTYQLEGLPSGANFNAGTRTLQWTPGFDQAGSYTLTYVVMDEAAATARTPVTLTVRNTNRPPQIKSVGDKSVKEGEELSFRVEAEDPDQEDQGKLNFSASGLPAGANFNGNTGMFTWIPRDDQQGNYQVTFTVSDPQGERSETAMRISVEDVPPPPPPAPENQ